MIPPWARTLTEQLEAVGLPEVKLPPIEDLCAECHERQRRGAGGWCGCDGPSWVAARLIAAVHADRPSGTLESKCLVLADAEAGRYEWRSCSLGGDQ